MPDGHLPPPGASGGDLQQAEVVQPPPHRHLRDTDPFRQRPHGLSHSPPEPVETIRQRVVDRQDIGDGLEHRPEVVPELPLGTEQPGPGLVRVMLVEELVLAVRDAVAEGHARHDRLGLAAPEPVGQLVAERPEGQSPDRGLTLGSLNPVEQPVPRIPEAGLGVAGLVPVQRRTLLGEQDSISGDGLSTQVPASIRTATIRSGGSVSGQSHHQPEHAALGPEEPDPAVLPARPDVQPVLLPGVGLPQEHVAPFDPAELGRPVGAVQAPDQEQPLERDGVLVEERSARPARRSGSASRRPNAGRWAVTRSRI